MQLTLEIPDPVAAQLTENGADLTRSVLEAIALAGYRNRTLSEYQMRLLLGFESRWELWDFLREKKEPSNYNLDDWEQDRRAADEMSAHHERSAIASR